MGQLLLQISQISHILEMKTHVGCKDRVDHKLPHGNIREGVWPVSAKDLRVGRTVEGLEYGAVIVELGQWRVEGDQKGVVDTRMTHIMPYCRDEQGQGVEGLEESGDWRSFDGSAGCARGICG